MVNIKKASYEDVVYVGEHMREADINEMYAAHRVLPREAVEECYKEECWCAVVDGAPSILFGCSNGVPWMLATDDIKKIGIRFVRQSSHYVKEWLAIHKYLSNYVHADNYISIRWLQWLGFTMKERVIINDENFYLFEMKEG